MKMDGNGKMQLLVVVKGADTNGLADIDVWFDASLRRGKCVTDWGVPATT